MLKEKNSKKVRLIAKSIISGSFSASAWVFVGLIYFGEITINAFLSPSIYSGFSSSSVALNLFNNRKKKKGVPSEIAIRQSIRRLQKQGFVKKVGKKYLFTIKGAKAAEYISDAKRTIDKVWDGKYRVVIFDIPEKKRKIRNWLRWELMLLDFRKLQESVFISRHPLTGGLIKEIKKKGIGNYVNYLLVDRVYQNIF